MILAVAPAASATPWIRGGAWLLVLGLVGVTVAALPRALQAAGMVNSWSYRLAFFFGCGLGAAAGIRSGRTPEEIAVAAGAGLLAAFAGGLIASSRRLGLWEDNQPPAAETVARVRQAHLDRLGPQRPAPTGKALLDRIGSALGILAALPFGTLLLLGLWLEDPGPLFFVKNSVGAGGRNFRQWKIRTMVRGAESESGPVWAEREDERVLHLGRLLRRSALDELPQLVNILVGQMSLVGPRPQRTVLVAEYLETLPEYAERHRLAPGLAGLAQVAGHYYLTPRQKLRLDRLYLRHAGLCFDLRLILIAIGVVFWLRWRPSWNGRLPRRWLHPGHRSGPSDSA